MLLSRSSGRIIRQTSERENMLQIKDYNTSPRCRRTFSRMEELSANDNMYSVTCAPPTNRRTTFSENLFVNCCNDQHPFETLQFTRNDTNDETHIAAFSKTKE